MTFSHTFLAAPGGLISPITSFMLVVSFSFLICIAVGLGSDKASDFFTANRSLSTVWNTLALCGDYLSVTFLLSSVGAVALGGFDGIVVVVSLTGAVAVITLLAGPIRNTGRFTLGGMLDSRMPGAATRTAGAVVTLAVCLPMMMIQLTVAGDATAYVLGLHSGGAAQVCTAFIGTLIVSFAAFGGMQGTSMIQIAKIVAVLGMFLALTWVVLAHTHWDPGAILKDADGQGGGQGNFYSPGLLYGKTATGTMDLLSGGVTIVLGLAAMPPMLMRVSMFRDARTARRAARSTAVIIALFVGAAVFTGLSAAAKVGAGAIASSDSQGYTALFTLSDSVSGGSGDLLFTIVPSAVFITALGTTSGLTLAAAASLVHDLYARADRRSGPGDEGEVSVARWFIMLFGMLGTVLAVVLHHWSITSLTSFATAVAASTALPALTYSLFWKGFTRTGLYWTVYGSLICCTVLELFGTGVSGSPYALFPEADFHWFPLQNIALVSVPAGFFLGWAGSRLKHRPGPQQRPMYDGAPANSERELPNPR